MLLHTDCMVCLPDFVVYCEIEGKRFEQIEERKTAMAEEVKRTRKRLEEVMWFDVCGVQPLLSAV